MMIMEDINSINNDQDNERNQPRMERGVFRDQRRNLDGFRMDAETTALPPAKSDGAAPQERGIFEHISN